MKETEKLMKSLSGGLKSLAAGINEMARMLENLDRDAFQGAGGGPGDSPGHGPEDSSGHGPGGGPEDSPGHGPEDSRGHVKEAEPRVKGDRPVREPRGQVRKPEPEPEPERIRRKRANAPDAVFKVISRSKDGVDTATLAKKTGYGVRTVHNAVSTLKKEGRIITPRRGVYTKA